MLKQFTKSLCIGVSKTNITLAQIRRWRRSGPDLLTDIAFDDLNSADNLSAALRKVLGDNKVNRQTATLILANEWVRYFQVTPPHNTARPRDCVAAAHMRFRTLYDISPFDWRIDAHWDARRPFLACAVPLWLLEVLHQAARERNLVLIGILPRFLVAWDQWKHHLRPNSWFGEVQARELTISQYNGKQLGAVHSIPIPVGANEEPGWLTEILTRTALLLGVQMPTQIALCGNVPDAWFISPDSALHMTRLDKPSSVEKSQFIKASIAMQGARS